MTQLSPLSQSIALMTIDLSLEYSLPMADSLVLATAETHESELSASNPDFREVAGAHVI